METSREMCWGKMTLQGGAMVKYGLRHTPAQVVQSSWGQLGKSCMLLRQDFPRKGALTASNGAVMFRVASVPHSLKGTDDDCTLSRRER